METDQDTSTSSQAVSGQRGTNPTPYLGFAYGLGLVAIISYAGFLLLQRRKLRRLLQTLREDG